MRKRAGEVGMKRKLLFLALAIAVLTTAVSCRDDEDEVEAIHLPEEVAALGAPSWALRAVTWFYVIDGEDHGDETTAARWAGQMSLGDIIYTGETRRMIFTGDANRPLLSFTEARTQDGREIFVLPHQVAVGGQLAVVTDMRASLFSGARPVDVTGTILSRGTVVAYNPVAGGEFVNVRGFDYGRNALVGWDNGFVRASALSTRESDVQAAILMRTALALPAGQAERREALLNMAFFDYQDSAFGADIFEILNPTPAVSEDAAHADGFPTEAAPEDYAEAGFGEHDPESDR